MTFDTITAAASSGPSRRSRRVGSGGTAAARARALLAEDLDLGVHELAVLQHRHARLRTGVAEVRSEDNRRGGSAGREASGPDGADEMLAPGFGFADAAEDRVDLHACDLPVGYVLQLDRDARHQFVLAVRLEAGVVPAGVDVGDLERLLDFDVPRTAGDRERQRQE
jgi:hypothetical protein